MSDHGYLESHVLQNAFVASRLDRLADLIGEQGELMLRDAGIKFPSRTVSAVMLIGERGGISAADIADVLRQPHQLVTQRLEILIGIGVVDRLTDPEDRRRKILRLTEEGAEQYAKLKIQLNLVERAFTALFEEIGHDIPLIANLAIEALERVPIRERLKTL